MRIITEGMDVGFYNLTDPDVFYVSGPQNRFGSGFLKKRMDKSSDSQVGWYTYLDTFHFIRNGGKLDLSNGQ